MTDIVVGDVYADAKGLRVGPLTMKFTAGVHALLGETADGVGLVLHVLAGAAKHRGSISGRPASTGVATVFADLSLPEELSCVEYIGLANEFRRIARVPNEVLERFGLTDWTRIRIQKLPKPERKALAIAEALTSGCLLVLLEAPFVGVTSSAAAAIEKSLQEQVSGRLCVFSTSQTETATRFSDYVAVLEAGRVVIHTKADDPMLFDGRYRVDCTDPGKLLTILRKAAGDGLHLEVNGDTLWAAPRSNEHSDVAKLITRAAAEGSINVRLLTREAAVPEVARARLAHQMHALRTDGAPR